MHTATKDLMLRFREQSLDTHAAVLADQTRAGLDILTNGDYHLDEDFAGRSWHHYPLKRWLGLEQRYVAAANPGLQTDVLPDREPLTHLPSPWH